MRFVFVNFEIFTEKISGLTYSYISRFTFFRSHTRVLFSIVIFSSLKNFENRSMLPVFITVEIEHFARVKMLTDDSKIEGSENHKFEGRKRLN